MKKKSVNYDDIFKIYYVWLQMSTLVKYCNNKTVTLGPVLSLPNVNPLILSSGFPKDPIPRPRGRVEILVRLSL